MPPSTKTFVTEPLSVVVSSDSVLFAESAHAPEFSMQARKDPFYKLIFVLSGRTRFSSEHLGQRDLGKGSFFPVTVNTPHSIEDLSPSTLLILCLGKHYIEKDSLYLEIWHKVVGNFQRGAMPSILTSQEISSLWKLAILEQLGVRFGHELSIRTAAARILLSLSRMSVEENAQPSGNSRSRIQSLVDSLEKTFFEDWSLDRASLATRLSKKQFTKLFKETTNMTFLQKLTQLRMAHATSLLARTEQSVLSISFSCGYQDLSHFYRVFKQTWQCAPNQWRAKHKQTPADTTQFARTEDAKSSSK